jgi:rare lipoprotein A
LYDSPAEVFGDEMMASCFGKARPNRVNPSARARTSAARRTRTLSCVALFYAVALLSGCQRECAREPAHYPQLSNDEADRELASAGASLTPPEERVVLEGQASYYSDSLAGNHTANGERYNPRSLTAAHRSLPFGTHVRVTRDDTRESVIVRINDRGPFAGRRRIIDLSRAAAERLAMLRAGVVDVHVEVLGREARGETH